VPTLRRRRTRARRRDTAAAPSRPAGVLCRAAATDTDILELTEANVETVLDEVRPASPARGFFRARVCHAAWRGAAARAAPCSRRPPARSRPAYAHAHSPHAHPARAQVRPYLMADGGNVEFVEIDGLVVKLRLKGACGSCPSSLTTMTMGIKRRLMERIPVGLWAAGGRAARGGAAGAMREPARRLLAGMQRMAAAAAAAAEPSWRQQQLLGETSRRTPPRPSSSAPRRRSWMWSRSPTRCRGWS
jgi:Fe-S cluster biogenesis protein NfuA